MRKALLTLGLCLLTSVSFAQFFQDLRKDYKATASQLDMFVKANVCTPLNDSNILKQWQKDNTSLIKKKKRESYSLVTKWLLLQGRNAILAPFCYTLWWWNKNKITQKVYNQIVPIISENDSLNINNAFLWLNQQIEEGSFSKMYEQEVRKIGCFWYFIWTFSDIEDPLGRGGLPIDYKAKPNIDNNSFKNRFLYSAIRNPGGLSMHIYQRSGEITNAVTTIDTRTDEEAVSYGIGNQQLGTWLCWYVDSDNRLYFIYEKASEKRIFYCGFVRTFASDNKGVLKEQNRKRFEVSARKNKALTDSKK
ncbi:MAG: hypothetical protein LBR17_01895 [Bacteroidales bacterium]|jgi:hypothetical protein|nr:hypothetical protein [Bacteroidales bacterium]